MSNFEEKALINAANAWVEASSKHGENTREVFVRVTAHALRHGRLDALNILRTTKNATDRNALTEFLLSINQKAAETVYANHEDVLEDIKLLEGYNEGRMLIFKRPKPDGDFELGTSPAAKHFRTSLKRVFNDDDATAAAFDDVYSILDKDTASKAGRVFDEIKVLKQVIDRIISNSSNPAQAKSLAVDLNKVIVGHFGKSAAYNASEIDQKVKQVTNKEAEELAKAMEIIERHKAKEAAEKAEREASMKDVTPQPEQPAKPLEIEAPAKRKVA